MYARAYPYSSPREKVISGAGAFGMHLLFVALLVFGVNWQKNIESPPNIVDLWDSLPPPEPKAEVKSEPPPQPAEPARIEPPVPKDVPKPEATKPDIAVKAKAEKAEKAEKERRALEQAEARKRDDEAREALKLQQAKAADAQRLAKEQEEVQRKLAEQAAAVRLGQIEKYKASIRDKIRRFIVLPPNLQGNPEAEFDVYQLPAGEVLDVKLRRSSNNTAYDSAIERAIRRAQPLPPPPDPSLFQRELNLTFRAQEK